MIKQGTLVYCSAQNFQAPRLFRLLAVSGREIEVGRRDKRTRGSGQKLEEGLLWRDGLGQWSIVHSYLHYRPWTFKPPSVNQSLFTRPSML